MISETANLATIDQSIESLNTKRKRMPIRLHPQHVDEAKGQCRPGRAAIRDQTKKIRVVKGALFQLEFFRFDLYQPD